MYALDQCKSSPRVRFAHLLPDYSGRRERGRQQCREKSLTDCRGEMARLVYLLSPAKTLDMSAPALRLCSQPALLQDAHELVIRC
jgi:hypothetical protein